MDRLLCPWDSPGKNTGGGCHFLLQCMKVKSESEVAQSCLTLSDPMDCSLPGSSVHGILQAGVLEWGAIALVHGLANSRTRLSDFYFHFQRMLFVGLPWWLRWVKNLPAMWETQIQSLSGEDTLEKGMATHSSVLAWRIPGTGEPGGLPSMGSHRVGHD